MSLFWFHLRSFSVSAFENSLCRPKVRSFDPLIPSQRGIFSGRGLCDLPVYEFFQIFLSICSVTPFLDQVFRCFFSMDNLRDYGGDDTASSSGLGRSMAKLPSSSEGHPAPTSSQAPVMADSTPATTLVTSGPVPAVSAPTTPASSVPKDSTLALDDLPPPPPPPPEPYEVFLARVQRELSSLPVRSAQPGAAVPSPPAVVTPTTGSRLPTPFPRYEDSSWAPQPQAPSIRIRMPLPASCYVPPPSPWVWPGRGPAVDATMVRGPPPATLPSGPPGHSGPSGLLAGPSAVGPFPVPFLHLLPTPSADLKKTSPTPPCHAPFIPTAPSSSVNNVAPTLTQQEAGTFSQGPTPEMIKGWKEEFMVDMRNCWKQFVGDLSQPWVPLLLLRTWARPAAAAESHWRPRGVKGSA